MIIDTKAKFLILKYCEHDIIINTMIIIRFIGHSNVHICNINEIIKKYSQNLGAI